MVFSMVEVATLYNLHDTSHMQLSCGNETSGR
jgi:hypothetical protein